MKVCIIGGGASGLVAAIACAGAGGEVTVFEKNDSPGRKLRSTGNGKCNLTNTDFDSTYYNTDSPGIMEGIFSGFGPEDTLSFFRGLGLLTRTMNGTCIYPASEQAQSVVDVLWLEAKRLGVRIVTGAGVDAVMPKDEGFRVSYHHIGNGYNIPAYADGDPHSKEGDFAAETLKNKGGLKSDKKKKSIIVKSDEFVRLISERFDRVILACGTGAGLPGGERNQYNTDRLIKSLGLPYIPFYGALNALECEGGFRDLAGVRVKGRIEVKLPDSLLPETANTINNKKDHLCGYVKIDEYSNTEKLEAFYDKRRPENNIISQIGEIQFTDQGVSGICVFQLSRFLGRLFQADDRLKISGYIDMLRDVCESDDDLVSFMLDRKKVLSDFSADNIVKGLIHKKIGLYALKKCGIPAGRELSHIRDEDVVRLCRYLMNFPITVTGLRPMENAQIWGGGVELSALTENMEVRGMPGLYVCGEMANVDGPCGGYNLQWAFSSGYRAGVSAAAIGNNTKK